ncbi:hypothetical protein IIA79_03830 [bacterium]|nr:hypothetical protein [bacterium]
MTARMHFDQGRKFFSEQDYDNASDHFKLAVDTDPLYKEAHTYLAETYEKLGYNHRAKKAWQNLLRIVKDPERQAEINQRITGL